jgi:hypothetical protein
MRQLETITVEELLRAALRLAWGGKRPEIAATGVNRALYLAARNNRERDPSDELKLSKDIVDRARELIAIKSPTHSPETNE